MTLVDSAPTIYPEQASYLAKHIPVDRELFNDPELPMTLGLNVIDGPSLGLESLWQVGSYHGSFG
jgi:hypothetical protein